MYLQKEKIKVRELVICKAIENLTKNRQTSVCVEADYVDKIQNFYLGEIETQEQIEVSKVNDKDLESWKNMYSSFNGKKDVKDLIVCYLSGPEPQSDFDEFTKWGVLPQNILAFESDKNTYLQALNSLDSYDFSNPKILKYGIENYFKDIPKKFDIIYIDACGSVPSAKHALRCFSSMCKFHRLQSPGVVITNFSSPNGSNESQITKEFIEILTLYFFCKDDCSEKLEVDETKKCISSNKLSQIRNNITEDFNYYYGEFLTSILMDISSVIIPCQRFINSSFIGNVISKNISNIRNGTIRIDDINSIKNNSLFKFISICKYYEVNVIDENLTGLMNQLIIELTGLDSSSGIDLYSSLYYIDKIKRQKITFQDNIVKQIKFFSGNPKIHQFLDKPNSNLYIDYIINQIAYPFHPVVDKIERYSYKAKETIMYTDVLVLDECRYIYEWLPTINQIDKAYLNFSLQYIFRFSLDGLVKNRMKYNNEIFFQGSVISKNENGFENKELKSRNIVNGDEV